MVMTFTQEQVEELKQPIDLQNVAERKTGWDQKVPFVESWKAIDEANRIFGFDGWSSETIQLDCVQSDEFCVTYIAKVRVTVGDVIKEGVGAGHGKGEKVNLGDKHESAVKEAESDARKRAFMQFGYQFGLSLYDSKKAWKNAKKDRSAEPVENILVLAKDAITKATDRKKLDAIAKKIGQRYDENQISRKDYNTLLDLLNNKYEEVSS
jgi:DNA repair and recombination protein RAD52